MVRKITTILLLIVILTSIFIVVSSSVAYAKPQPNYYVCGSWITYMYRCHTGGWLWAYQKRQCCAGFGGPGGGYECWYEYRSVQTTASC